MSFCPLFIAKWKASGNNNHKCLYSTFTKGWFHFQLIFNYCTLLKTQVKSFSFTDCFKNISIEQTFHRILKNAHTSLLFWENVQCNFLRNLFSLASSCSISTFRSVNLPLYLNSGWPPPINNTVALYWIFFLFLHTLTHLGSFSSLLAHHWWSQHNK